MGLNPRQQKFVSEYLKSGNATQSAIAAGYSANGAEVQGHRLLSNAKICTALSKPLEKAVVTSERIAAELAKAGFATPEAELSWSDKHKALELLGRHLGMFQDDRSGNVQAIFQINLHFEGGSEHDVTVSP